MSDDEIRDLREELGVTCVCLGPPYYVCPHWPAFTAAADRENRKLGEGNRDE